MQKKKKYIHTDKGIEILEQLEENAERLQIPFYEYCKDIANSKEADERTRTVSKEFILMVDKDTKTQRD